MSRPSAASSTTACPTNGSPTGGRRSCASARSFASISTVAGSVAGSSTTTSRPPKASPCAPSPRSRGSGPTPTVVELARWTAWRWAGRLAATLTAASPGHVVTALPAPAPAPPSRRWARRPSRRTPTARSERDEAVMRVPASIGDRALVLAAVRGRGRARWLGVGVVPVGRPGPVDRRRTAPGQHRRRVVPARLGAGGGRRHHRRGARRGIRHERATGRGAGARRARRVVQRRASAGMARARRRDRAGAASRACRACSPRRHRRSTRRGATGSRGES